MLIIPDDLAANTNNFWEDYNVPFLDEAIARNGVFSLATEPNRNSMYRKNSLTGDIEMSGFGREIRYLENHGYFFDAGLMQMIPLEVGE